MQIAGRDASECSGPGWLKLGRLIAAKAPALNGQRQRFTRHRASGTVAGVQLYRSRAGKWLLDSLWSPSSGLPGIFQTLQCPEHAVFLVGALG